VQRIQLFIGPQPDLDEVVWPYQCCIDRYDQQLDKVMPRLPRLPRIMNQYIDIRQPQLAFCFRGLHNDNKTAGMSEGKHLPIFLPSFRLSSCDWPVNSYRWGDQKPAWCCTIGNKQKNALETPSTASYPEYLLQFSHHRTSFLMQTPHQS
jgi:hypothetical protein